MIKEIQSPSLLEVCYIQATLQTIRIDTMITRNTISIFIISVLHTGYITDYQD